MAVHYGEPFRLYSVKHPTTGERRQLTDQAQAEKLAAKLAKETGRPPSELLTASRAFYAFEYKAGARGGRRVCTGEETKFLAAEWCRKRQREGRGAHRNARKPLDEAIGEWLEELREEKDRSAKTLNDYRLLSNHWRKAFGSKTVGEVAQADVKPLFRRGLAARSKIKHLVVLRSFFKWAVSKAYAETNPTDGMTAKTWKPERWEPRALSEEEVSRLLRACREPFAIVVKREDFRPYQNEQEILPPAALHPVVACALTTLLRLSNILDLRWGEVSLETGLIRIPPRKVKTRTELVLPIGRALKACLLELPKGGGEDFVFGGQKEIKRAFGSAMARAGIKDATFHALRRTGATVLLKAGVAREVVERLGGWRSSGGVMIEHYRNVDMSELRAAVEVLDRLVSGTVAAQNAREVS